MKVILSGFNVDREVLAHLPKRFKEIATPETISAAYARISRSEKSVDKLRKIAQKEIKKARNSNQRIIFEMGHHSIAEHSVFNFDIINISRFATEKLEHFRLASYTEKSQRYVTFKKGYFIPPVLKRTREEKKYINLIEKQFSTYRHLVKKLIKHYKNKGLFKKEKEIELKAKEDARYILPLATYTQLGMTMNARTLEYLLRKFAASPLDEIQKLGEKLFNSVKEIAPSLLLFYKATDYETKTPLRLKNLAKIYEPKITESDEDVKLLYHTGNDFIPKALLYPYLTSSLSSLDTLKDFNSLETIKEALKDLEFYDATPREFELGFLIYELIISATAYAQLKRHRMATIITQDYNPALGIKLPPSIKESGQEKIFKKMIKETEELYEEIKERFGSINAQYILTNAHRRRILVALNPRELYHISRLREDESAQWDIREIVRKMCAFAGEAMPDVFILLGGKDKYPMLYQKIYHRPPKFHPP